MADIKNQNARKQVIQPIIVINPQPNHLEESILQNKELTTQAIIEPTMTGNTTTFSRDEIGIIEFELFSSMIKNDSIKDSCSCMESSDR